jgi:DNA-binding CsgD family transcriptional regulator
LEGPQVVLLAGKIVFAMSLRQPLENRTIAPPAEYRTLLDHTNFGHRSRGDEPPQMGDTFRGWTALGRYQDGEGNVSHRIDSADPIIRQVTMKTELTNRERQVARLVAQGLSNRKIANAMDLVEGTVKIHLHHVYKKLDVANRIELVLRMQKRKQRARLLKRSKHRQLKKHHH